MACCDWSGVLQRCCTDGIDGLSTECSLLLLQHQRSATGSDGSRNAAIERAGCTGGWLGVSAVRLPAGISRYAECRTAESAAIASSAGVVICAERSTVRHDGGWMRGFPYRRGSRERKRQQRQLNASNGDGAANDALAGSTLQWKKGLDALRYHQSTRCVIVSACDSARFSASELAACSCARVR